MEQSIDETFGEMRKVVHGFNSRLTVELRLFPEELPRLKEFMEGIIKERALQREQ